MATTASDGTTYNESTSACGDTARCHDETNPCGCLPDRTDLVDMALADLHPDEKVHDALWRLYHEAPGLLDSRVWVTLQVSTNQPLAYTMGGLRARRRGTA